MTQTPDYSSSRLDRIEAILERTVADREADRQQINEVRSSLRQLTTRVDNLVERVVRFEEQTDRNISELVRGQASIIELTRQLTLGQVRLDQTVEQISQTQAQLQQTVARIEETQASLAAAQERQERLLDYLIRRSE